MRHYLVAVPDTQNLCGVAAFSKHLAAALGVRGHQHVLDFNVISLWKALGSCDGLVLNFPIVAWKKRLLEPLLAAATAKLRRKTVTVILHEWASLDWKRRAVLWPVILLADVLLFSAPEIRLEYTRNRPRASQNKRLALIPIPPNISIRNIAVDTPAVLSIREHRKQGRMIIGQFGSIYPKKNCAELLKIAQNLVSRGHDVAVVFIGSFIKALDDVEADFYRQVDDSDLNGRVLVTGYIGGDDEVLAALQEVDVFCYRFTEGLTSRRGSVLAAALSGRPVVTNAPRDQNSLTHHGLYRTLIANGNIILAPVESNTASMADIVVSAANQTPVEAKDLEVEIALLWENIVEIVDREVALAVSKAQ